jgi:hypothetical protein
MIVTLFFALFACVYSQTAQFTVTGNVRNEFQQEMTLISATLTAGTFTTKPMATIDLSANYGVLFVATGGEDGVVGTVVYGAQGAPNVKATFTFENINGNQTSTAVVAPPPWIGGVATPTGTASNINFFF